MEPSQLRHPATVEAPGPSFQGSYRLQLFDQIAVCRRLQLVDMVAFHRSLVGLRGIVIGLISDRPERLESFRATCYHPTPALVKLDKELADDHPDQDFREELGMEELSDWFEDMLAFLGRYNYLTYADLSSTV